MRALFSKRTEEDFSLTTLLGFLLLLHSSSTSLSTALLSVLFVVFHSLICSVITAKNDREQFLSISTREKSLLALSSSSGPPFFSRKSSSFSTMYNFYFSFPIVKPRSRMLTNESSIEEGYFFFIYLFISFFLSFF